MTEPVENLILEMLKGIRNDTKDFRTRYEEDMDDLKTRMSSLENAMVSVKREVNHSDEVSVRQQVSLDKIMKRIERIEHRLDLASPQTGS
jgi:predicted  nucleic acid-binding Zn-ribbon protein